MSSAANPTAWSPYDSYKDCSQRICSIYCPQWCYIIFPPPPPFEAEDGGDSGTNFSPLIIAVIGILGSAFLLVSYYTIISKYCKRRTSSHDHQNSSNELELNQNQVTHDQSQQQQPQVVLNGLDESLIKSIAVFKYKIGDGLIEGTDCAVCLSEFQENESLRLLPKCSHAFHLPCIDTWLRSHSNCPLCRSNIVSFLNLLPVQTGSSTTVHVSNLEMRRQSDLVLVIDDRDSRVNQEQVFDHVMGNSEERTSSMINQENEQEGVQEMRSTSFSLGSFSCQGNLLIADILDISDDELDLCEEICESQMGNSSVSTKRSNSRHDNKGKNLVLPS